MSKKKRREAKNVVHGDVIGGVVGDKGKAKVGKIVTGDEIKLTLGDDVEILTSKDDPFFEVYQNLKEFHQKNPKQAQKVAKEVEQIKSELQKEEEANDSFLEQRLKNIRRMAPDIFDIILKTIANPVNAFTEVAKKIAEKISRESDAEQEAGEP